MVGKYLYVVGLWAGGEHLMFQHIVQPFAICVNENEWFMWFYFIETRTETVVVGVSPSNTVIQTVPSQR